MERRTYTFGGDGGGPFSPRSPDSVGLRSGSLVDAIIINGEQFGGSGGCNPTIENLGSDDYWSAIQIRSGSLIDRLRLVSHKGRTVEGGGDGGGYAEHSNLRIISISGRSGAMVDSLSFDVVCDYVPSTPIERNVEVIMDVQTGGQVIKHYSDEATKTMHSFQLVTQHMMSLDLNASAEGEYFAKFSASTNYKTSDSRTETIASQAEQSMQSGTSTEQTIPANCAAFLVGKADIMCDSDGHHWMAPTSGANWVVLSSDRFASLAGKYDLTGGAGTQAGLGSALRNGFPRLT